MAYIEKKFTERRYCVLVIAEGVELPKDYQLAMLKKKAKTEEAAKAIAPPATPSGTTNAVAEAPSDSNSKAIEPTRPHTPHASESYPLPPNADEIYVEQVKDIGIFLKEKIDAYFATKHGMPYKITYIDPSYIIRSVPPIGSDILDCGLLGNNAVHAAMSGYTGVCIGNVHGYQSMLPFDVVTSGIKKVNPRGSLWQNVLETTGQPDLLNDTVENRAFLGKLMFARQQTSMFAL